MSTSITRRELVKRTGILIGVGTLASLAACTPTPAPTPVPPEATAAPATKAPEPTEAPTAAPAQPVEINYYNQWLDVEQGPLYEKMVADFMVSHPNIKVNLENITGQDSLAQLQARFAAGQAPDMFILNSGTYAPFAVRDLLLALDDLMAADPEMNKDLYLPLALRLGTYKGKVVAPPYSVTPGALFYNVDMFKKANVGFPTGNWTVTGDFLNAAQALTNDAKGKEKTWGYDMCCAQANEIFSAFEAWWVTDDGTKSRLTEPRTVEAFQFVTDLYIKHKVAPMKGVEEDWKTFYSGRQGMMKIFPWTLNYNNENCKFNWDIAPLPKESVAGCDPWTNLFCLAKSTKAPKEAFELLKWATYRVWTFRNEMPPFTSMAATWTATDPKHNLQAFVDALMCDGKWLMTINQHPKVDEINRIVNAYWQKALIGEQAVPAMLKDAEAELNAALSRA